MGGISPDSYEITDTTSSSCTSYAGAYYILANSRSLGKIHKTGSSPSRNEEGKRGSDTQHSYRILRNTQYCVIPTASIAFCLDSLSFCMATLIPSLLTQFSTCVLCTLLACSLYILSSIVKVVAAGANPCACGRIGCLVSGTWSGYIVYLRLFWSAD